MGFNSAFKGLTEHSNEESEQVAGLQALACWDCGFESRRQHGCLSVVGVVFCEVQVSAAGRSFVQRSPVECVRVTESDHQVRQ